METIDYNSIVKDFKSTRDAVVAQLYYAKQEARNIADLASQTNSKILENIDTSFRVVC